MTSHPINVTCAASDNGWTCRVTVGSDAAATTHRVGVRAQTATELAPGSSAEDLVRRSFAFLLDREPRTSILASFDLADIERYFPEYTDEIARRMRAGRDQRATPQE